MEKSTGIVTDWTKATPGDLVGNTLGHGLLIARKIDRKWRAKRLAEHIDGSQVWLDGPKHWAVILPLAGQ
jgi:hypothetical protein